MGQETHLLPSNQQMKALLALPAGRPLLLQYHWRWLNSADSQQTITEARAILRRQPPHCLSVATVEALAIGEADKRWSEIWLLEFSGPAEVEAHLASELFERLCRVASDLEIVVATPPPPRMARIIRWLNRVLPWLPAPRSGDHLPAELLQGGINPTPQQLAFFQEEGPQQPIHMFNLLKFHERAQYVEGERNRSGRRAYEDGYGRVAMDCFLRLGGRIVTLGRYRFTLVGNDGQTEGNHWDEIAVIEYPGRQQFTHMISNPRYQAALEHRDAGLQRTLVWCTSPAAEYSR